MNKEDSLYIKKRFGAKVLAVLKRLTGSDSSESGGFSPVKGKISIGQSGGIYPNINNSNLSTFTNNKAVLAKIARIEITNENLHTLTFGFWTIVYMGNGWRLYNSKKGIDLSIQGTTASTKSNDPLIISEINKIVELQEVYLVNNGSITTTGVICDFYKQGVSLSYEIGGIEINGNITEADFSSFSIH